MFFKMTLCIIDIPMISRILAKDDLQQPEDKTANFSDENFPASDCPLSIFRHSTIIPDLLISSSLFSTPVSSKLPLILNIPLLCVRYSQYLSVISGETTEKIPLPFS